MTSLEALTANLAEGFSKTDLENLIGLPKNSLSGVINKGRKISKKNEVKVLHWQKTKPTLIEFLAKQHIKKEREVRKDEKLVSEIIITPDFQKFPSDQKDEYAIATAKSRIETLEKEIKNPTPSTISKKIYISIRENELAELKNKYDL